MYAPAYVVPLCVSLPACLFVCLSVSMPACMSAFLLVCPACLCVPLPVFLPVCLSQWLSVCLSAVCLCNQWQEQGRYVAKYEGLFLECNEMNVVDGL